MNVLLTFTGALHVAPPSSEWITWMAPPPTLKLFQLTYIRPKCGLEAVLSTVPDSRSSPEPLWAHGPALHVLPSGEVQTAMP